MPTIFLLAALSLHSTAALGVCKDYSNFKQEDSSQVIGGVALRTTSKDKIDAYFYGEMCWTSSESLRKASSVFSTS